MKTLKFPKEYDLKVDLKKVNWEVIKGWVARRITELLGLEDEVVIGYVLEQLEDKQVRCAHGGLLSLNVLHCVVFCGTCMNSIFVLCCRGSTQGNCK